MHTIVSFVFLAVIATWTMHAQDNILGPDFQRQSGRSQRINNNRVEILAPVKPWDLLGQGYQLTGDSAVDKDGNVYFTDARRNRILKIGLDGKINAWKEGSNGAHGVALGPDGRLYAGQHNRKRIVAFSRDGTESVIAEGVQPHRLTVTARNEIYFTEPSIHTVWMVDPGGYKRVAHEGINLPHSVRASADQSRLIVNDPPTRWVWSFQIQADGSLINGRPFYGLETDDEFSKIDAGGMVFDTEGFLYVATKQGVQVCNQLGLVIAIIKTPGNQGVSDVFFGGPDLQWLYVTDGDKVFRRPVKRRGAGLWNTPQPRL